MTILDVGVAHQKLIREEKAASEKQNGDYWSHLNLNLKDAVVKAIDIKLAKRLIVEYEWLGCMAAVNWFSFGIFFDGVCGGVVCFGPEYIENLGRWDKYGYTGKIILLNRGVCLHWTPINTGSKLISEAMKMLPEKYEVVTCTTDHLAGEVGTIYQACNFHYVGSMRDSNPNVKSRNGDRDAWVIDGKIYGARNLRLKYGTTKMEVLKLHHPNVVKVKQNSKHRYFYFRGNKYQKKANLAAIGHLVKPYPKRNPDAKLELVSYTKKENTLGVLEFS